MIIVTIIYGILLFGCGFMLIRNQRVYTYRSNLLKKLSYESQSDIKNSRPFWWRYDAFDSVSYDEMMLRFWKPLDSFYKDKSFIQPSVK